MKRGWLSIFGKNQSETSQVDEASATRQLAVYGIPGVRPAPSTVQTTTLSVPTAPRARLVFALDLTASREHAMKTAVPLTDALLTAVQGDRLEVALAIHGGNRLHTWTRFETSVDKLRDRAASVRCQAGTTRLLDIFTRVLRTEGVQTIIYIGDTYEEDSNRALKLADALCKRGTRVIILHDRHSADCGADIFAAIAERTGGAVLPFNASSLQSLKDLVQAVGVLTVGGTPMLEAKRESSPAAQLLLQHLKGNKP